MRTAYINKENRVVYIAAFEEDKIIPNGKGKLLFGGSQWDGEKYIHSLGSGEEVFAVDGSGLGLGDVYTPLAEPTPPALEEQISQKEAELKALEKQLALDYLTEKTGKSQEFTAYLAEQAEGVGNE